MRIGANLAAALVAAAVPLLGGPTAAAPLSQALAVSSVDSGTVEQVQYRRWNRGYRSIGWNRGYRSVGWNRGYRSVGWSGYRSIGWNRGGRWIGPARGYYYRGRLEPWQRLTPQYGSCTGDRYLNSAYPSWACR